MKFSPKYFAFATVLSFALIPMATSVETASVPSLLNGNKLNGIQVNGWRLNALSANGIAINGIRKNGLTFNGAELSRPSTSIATLDGKPIEAVSLEGSQLVLQVGSSAPEQ